MPRVKSKSASPPQLARQLLLSSTDWTPRPNDFCLPARLTPTYGKGEDMNREQTNLARVRSRMADRSGKMKYGIFAWMLGLPLPIILIALFYGGCDF